MYIAGSGTNDTTRDTNAAYWINGTGMTLPLPNNLTNSPAATWATGIALSGSDVYAVGSLDTSTASVGQTAVYWVNNGEATLLPAPSNTAESWASAIAVATQ